MQYYVLMDKDTSSIAASFCNILQYHGAALLAGEPLRRNALKYGETVEARFGISGLYLCVSTVEYDEYTRIGTVNVLRNKSGKLVKDYWGINQLGVSLLYDF